MQKKPFELYLKAHQVLILLADKKNRPNLPRIPYLMGAKFGVFMTVVTCFFSYFQSKIEKNIKNYDWYFSLIYLLYVYNLSLSWNFFHNRNFLKIWFFDFFQKKFSTLNFGTFIARNWILSTITSINGTKTIFGIFVTF